MLFTLHYPFSSQFINETEYLRLNDIICLIFKKLATVMHGMYLVGIYNVKKLYPSIENIHLSLLILYYWVFKVLFTSHFRYMLGEIGCTKLF